VGRPDGEGDTLQGATGIDEGKHDAGEDDGADEFEGNEIVFHGCELKSSGKTRSAPPPVAGVHRIRPGKFQRRL
jgi:hypothetical protein